MPGPHGRHGPLRVRPELIALALAVGCAAPDSPVIALSPAVPTTLDDLQVAVEDPDADRYTYAWTVDGRARHDQFGATLSQRHTAPGETWAVQVTAWRGQRESGAATAEVAIAPSVDAVFHTPDRPSARDAVTVEVGEVHGDAALEVRWLADGAEIATGDVLPAGLVARGQVLVAEVTPVLGDLTGPPTASAGVEVANAWPDAPVVEVDPPAADPGAADLVCAVLAEPVDPDGDDVDVVFSWWVDGRPWPGPAATTLRAGDTVPAASTADGAAWTCYARPDDGRDVGPPGVGRALVGDPCADDVDRITSPVHASFVVHSEEDDEGGVPGSNPTEPDYNGDQAVFTHYADALTALAVALSDAGATLSVQPDWTFVEGAATWRPDLFRELRALPGVEVAPHGHETWVLYDDLDDRLAAADADPQPYLGGMDFDLYAVRQDWFALHPEYAMWEAPTVTVDHVEDVLAPALVYRAPMPADVAHVEDLFFVDMSSTVVVSPAVASVIPGPGNVDPGAWAANKPPGRLITPAYIRLSLRDLLAAEDDTAVPEAWRTDDPYKVEDAVIADAVATVQDVAPFVEAGLVAWTPISEVLQAYARYESCLDLADGQDLSAFIPPTPDTDTGG